MDQLVKILTTLKESETPHEDIANILGTLNENNQIEFAEAIKVAYTSVMGNVSLSSWSYANDGRPYSIILSAVVNELPKLLKGEHINLEKYLMPIDNPFRSFRPNFNPNRSLTPKVEMLLIIQKTDIKSMCLLYMLFLLHIGA